jgi:hypothetical protein
MLSASSRNSIYRKLFGLAREVATVVRQVLFFARITASKSGSPIRVDLHLFKVLRWSKLRLAHLLQFHSSSGMVPAVFSRLRDPSPPALDQSCNPGTQIWESRHLPDFVTLETALLQNHVHDNDLLWWNIYTRNIRLKVCDTETRRSRT